MLAGREASELLQSALQKLSPELRETVILRDLEEMEYREIAEAPGNSGRHREVAIESGTGGTGAGSSASRGWDLIRV